jgi:hypothetical protein
MSPAKPGISDRDDGDLETLQTLPPQRLTTSESDEGAEARSGFGAVPGNEFPAFVYISVLAAFAWILLASWLTFARDMDADLALAMAIVLGIVLFGLPIIIHHVATTFARPEPEPARDFLSAPVETATGSLPGASAWLQVLLIPLALAFAATLFGAAFLLAR